MNYFFFSNKHELHFKLTTLYLHSNSVLLSIGGGNYREQLIASWVSKRITVIIYIKKYILNVFF